MKRRTRLAVRSLPAVFLVQGAEEVWTMPGWVADHVGSLPPLVVSFMPADSTVLTAALGILLVPFLVGGLLPLAPDGGGAEGDRGRVAFVALLVAALGTNALGHLGQAALTGGYVPGLASGILLCVPYAAWTLRELAREGLLSARGAAVAVLASGLLQVPVLLGLVAALRWLVG